MKARKETTLFAVLTGSHLYGNATATSDFDYKAVCMPPLDVLLANTKVTNRKEKPLGKGPSGKMLAGETETEYLPIQVFMDDFFNGQTYALEVVFAVLQGKYELPENHDGKLTDTVLRTIKEMNDRFLTKNVKKMVGYAVSQSKLYGLKTERYTSIKAVIDTINAIFDSLSMKMGQRADEIMNTVCPKDTPVLVEQLLKLDHVKMCMIENARGGSELAPALDISGKKYPMTSRWITISKSVRGTLDNYGERVKQFEGENVDWKALSHAIRITEQVIELCTTGKLVFPRPNAELLRTVKDGKMPLDEATGYLNEAFSKVDDVVAASVLQERTPTLEIEFSEWKLKALTDLYRGEMAELICG